MKLLFVFCLAMVGCGTAESVTAVAPPENNSTVDGGICCQITNNLTTDYPWYNARYTCITEGGLQPFNPPWICGINDAGNCGGDSGVECLTCDQPTCVVGMDCLGANGTGIVLPCDQADY